MEGAQTLHLLKFSSPSLLTYVFCWAVTTVTR